jgi:hypothetical protein
LPQKARQGWGTRLRADCEKMQVPPLRFASVGMTSPFIDDKSFYFGKKEAPVSRPELLMVADLAMFSFFLA